MIAGAVNSFFVEAAMTITEPGTVLALYIKELTGSVFLAGLLPSLRYFGWLAPQFFAAGRLQRLRRFLPAVQWLEAIRGSFYLLVAAAIALWSLDRPNLVLILFFSLFMVTRLAAGCSAVARNEIVARMVPEGQRAALISLRRLTGAVAGLLAGFLIGYILDARVASFPANYALLIAIAGLFFGLAVLSFSLVIEPELPIERRERNIMEQAKQAPRLLRTDRRYALYVGVRLASAGTALATPFYILFATELLGAPASMAGAFISMRTLVRIASNAFWGRECARRGSAWVLKAGTALGMLTPLTVVIFYGLMKLWGAQPTPFWVSWAFGLVFALQGLAGSAEGLAQIAYLYDISPPGERPTYYGLANTIVGPMHFLPALGGALVALVGYVPIFGVAALFMAVAYGLAARLEGLGSATPARAGVALNE
ncbi:MAG: MFS transporter [Chloroflexi bacterium]|nr:MFS transporter [Chloroflexota bacterium]